MQSKKDLWIKRIKDYKSSGLTAVNWCEENGINIHTLKYHITKINKEKKEQKANKTKWASVVPGQSRNTVGDEQLLKVTINNSTIEVPNGFDPVTFETVVRILKKQC